MYLIVTLIQSLNEFIDHGEFIVLRFILAVLILAELMCNLFNSFSHLLVVSVIHNKTIHMSNEYILESLLIFANFAMLETSTGWLTSNNNSIFSFNNQKKVLRHVTVLIHVVLRPIQKALGFLPI